MKFPYGISDFYQIMTEDYFYIDRTAAIPRIEGYGKNLLFLRPRRFGKSLFLSTLQNYYDVNKAAEFERLFAHLAIGQNPTENHNKYLVMRWNFSAVDSQGELEHIRRSLYDHINDRIQGFAVDYQEQLSQEIEIDRENALFSFGSALTAVRQTPYKMYLLIDEYDNFANSVLMSGHLKSRERYEELVKGEGLLKTVLSVVKAATEGLGLDRIFLTGVSPIVMSDITSGHNISEDISLEPEFYDLCGFWQHEIEAVLQQLVSSCDFPLETGAQALQMMRIFYDGYSFKIENEKKDYVYNPTLVLYFLKHYQRHCRPPRNMLDGNFAMDRAKIAYVASLPRGEQLITAALQEESVAIYQLQDRFGVAEMLNEQQERDFFASLLYYLGVLTLGPINDEGQLTLQIPNLVVRKLYVEHLQRSFLPAFSRDMAKKAASALRSKGNFEPLADFIEQHYFKIFDNRDYKTANELTLKTIFLTTLFNDIAYIMDSELALERTYSDLTMIVRPEMRQYKLLDILMEFKFIKLHQATGDKKVKLSGEQARAMSRTEVLQLQKVKLRMAEAVAQVKNYRQRLLDKYGETLRLRSYAVVSLGFERVVWQEVSSLL